MRDERGMASFELSVFSRALSVPAKNTCHLERSGQCAKRNGWSRKTPAPPIDPCRFREFPPRSRVGMPALMIIHSRAVLIHEGAPESAIRILAPEIVNTEDEERAIISEMQATRASRVIIVTSPPHTRRVRALWQRLAPTGLTLIVRSASNDDYDADHWWRTTRDSLSVMRETMGLLNAWAGLPVRPASH